MHALADAQEEEEHLGPFGDLLHTVAQIAYQRAADLILLNNRRIEQQLMRAGIVLPDEQTPTDRQLGGPTEGDKEQ
jgi:hypothetical protein